ncbi:MAG: UDP-N-acetylmuramoyl-L-alanyl-D-glutamate--2,6-diaminopimelate ligase [Candidatus Omnitrophota bacterium]|jgi:UDP-N-acetylmuramoyl-L-alanyl-D-glutamate--2,6-diaminopimelate ligase
MNTELSRLFEQGLIDRDSLSCDSRRVAEGDVFFALKGTRYDGHEYVPEALKKGAKRAICEHEIREVAASDKEKVIIVDDARKELGDAAKKAFDDPSKKLKVYGVTGTNGKTTTVFLIDNVLNTAGLESGIVSTVFTKTSGDITTRSSVTTPDVITLNRLLADMVSSGKKAAVLEISSHALAQDRIRGIKLDVAAFTNITPEHLDYHGDMETYLAEKTKIFRNLKDRGTGALNADDPMLKDIAKDIAASRLVTFGMKQKADVKAENIKMNSDGLRFELNFRDHGRINISSGLIGIYNVYNLLSAAAILSANGLDLGTIREGLQNAKAVPGRMDLVEGPYPFKVFVDYAHTPNALENALECLRPLAEKRLICVFGCGGDRDRSKRPVMGSIASRACDYVYLTNDNPRTESPEDIVGEIEKGMPDKTKYCIILQRREAIRKALKMAGEGDIVVIAGKGHENYQIIGDQSAHFDDKEVARSMLEELGYD